MAFGDIFPTVVPVTVADGATVSGAVDLRGRQLCGVYLPSTAEGTTLGFQVSDALAGTYLTLMSAGAAVSLTVAASRYVALDPNLFLGVRFLKLVLGTQTGASIINLAIR
jgi:hypothetical protein